MNISETKNPINSTTVQHVSHTFESNVEPMHNSNRSGEQAYMNNMKNMNNAFKPNQNVSLLPGKERILQVTRKSSENISSDEALGNQRTEDRVQSLLKEDNYMTANVTVSKRHIITRKHHHQRHRGKKTNITQKTNNDYRGQSVKNTSSTYNESEPTYSEYFADSKANSKRRIEVIELDTGKSSDEFATISGDNRNEVEVATPNIVESDDQEITMKQRQRSNLFVPRRRKHKNPSYWDKSTYSRSMGSLNRNNMVPGMEPASPVLCRKCQQNTCPQCLQVINSSIRIHNQEMLNHDYAHRHQLFSMSHPSLTHQSNHGSCTHLHEQHNHQYRLVPSWNMYYKAGSAKDNFQNNSSSKLEIEYIQSDEKDVTLFLNNEQLNWILNQALIYLAETRDLDLLAEKMKYKLDEQFGSVWHSVVGPDSYGSNISSLPGSLVSFVVNKHAFLFWKT